jgi:hypothetical protein
MAGHGDSGDLGLVHPYEGGAVIAVIDAIGHGDEAAANARASRDIITQDPEAPPFTLVARCHAGLRGTHGVVLGIASVDLRHGSLRWLGVGNVRGLVLRGAPRAERARDELLLRAGVVGVTEFQSLQTSLLPWRERDTLILATNGIHPNFADTPVFARALQALAEQILANHCRGADDALVLAARANRRPPAVEPPRLSPWARHADRAARSTLGH